MLDPRVVAFVSRHSCCVDLAPVTNPKFIIPLVTTVTDWFTTLDCNIIITLVCVDFPIMAKFSVQRRIICPRGTKGKKSETKTGNREQGRRGR